MTIRTPFFLAAALALGLVCASAAPGWADNGRPKAATPAKAQKKAKVKQLTFDTGSEIEGDPASPNGDNLSARTNVVHSSLIRLRHDFLREIHRSAEQL